jgi:hypothetical protein
MELSFEVSSLSVEPHGRNGVYATVEVEASDIIEQMLDADRLEGIDIDVALAWVLKNVNHDDILEAIGENKIHEFLSHAE